MKNQLCGLQITSSIVQTSIAREGGTYINQRIVHKGRHHNIIEISSTKIWFVFCQHHDMLVISQNDAKLLSSA